MKKFNFLTIKYQTVQKIYSRIRIRIRIIEIWNQDPDPYQNDTYGSTTLVCGYSHFIFSLFLLSCWLLVNKYSI